MRYRVILRPNVRKALNRLAEHDYRPILLRLRSLADEQRPPDVRKLAGTQLWRLRVRDFRIVYSVDDKEKGVNILRIARRSEDTYKGL